METKRVCCCLASGLTICIWGWMDFGWWDEESWRKPCRQWVFQKVKRLSRRRGEENAPYWLFFVPEGKHGASCRQLYMPFNKHSSPLGHKDAPWQDEWMAAGQTDREAQLHVASLQMLYSLVRNWFVFFFYFLLIMKIHNERRIEFMQIKQAEQ